MNVTARIDISTPTGRKIVRELEKHPKTVVMTYEEPEIIDGIPKETIPLDDAIDIIWDQLETKIGYDLRKTKK